MVIVIPSRPLLLGTPHRGSRDAARRRRSALLFLMLGLLVLSARVAGVHWHLCPDGLEERQSLHWSEPGLADELAHARASLRDSDICIAAEALASPSLPRLLAAAFSAIVLYCLILELSPRLALRFTHPRVRFERRSYLIPHPRGPPR